ncbi:retinoic acid receptor responder (tazarotene induced) 3 [Phytophthora pseudosyringae]|uniref:phospholipase A2 n=1 Tax=Phytophthora pseudosyringae TaxID=221518 RepID=A0A8T1W757_9STRA|nr:retinoic acid receptor responder (tazarotene induced) 3 [Phytophthora pseudosyringae]
MATTPSLALGDVVRFNRGQYSHLALYVGGGRVVHLWSPSESDFQVRVDSIRFVQRSAAAGLESEAPENHSDELDDKMLADHELRPFRGDEAVRRAMSRLGETQYSCLAHNCEHFVTWARYGLGASPQVASNANHVLAGAMVGAVVGGMAGFVVGGLISLFTKADALTTSASSGASMSAASTAGEDVAAEEEAGGRQRETEQQVRRAARELLWNGLPVACAPAAMDAMTQMEDWVETRRRRAAADSARKYSGERHNTLASRLAEEELQCSICYSDLTRIRAVAFPCNHFTCAVCYAAFQANMEGEKCCPYCRLPIVDAEEIHKSTKLRAKHLLHGDDE